VFTPQSRAFTMIEIAIALVLLAVALIPIVGVFLSSSEETRANKNRSIAAVLAASVLERCRHMRPEVLRSVKDWASVQEVQTQKSAMTAGPDVPSWISKDALVSPWTDSQQTSNSFLKEFGSIVQGRFRRFCSLVAYNAKAGENTPMGENDRSGWLSVTVVWTEKTAGVSRTVSYSLSTLVSDPIFPLGRAF